MIIPKPGFVPDVDETVTHLTGYNYDRTVPIAFAGFGIRKGTFTSAEILPLANRVEPRRGRR